MKATAAYPEVSESAVPELTIGQAKRVLEWWSCSEEFRRLLEVDPERAGREYNIGFNPELIRPLWDSFFAQDAMRKNLPVHPVVHAYRAFFNEKTRWRDEIKKECDPDDARFSAWRSRQIARNVMENGAYDEHIIHTPMAIELTDGCSVGCWFCGVGSTKLATSMPYDGNEELWRGVVSVLRDKIGNASKWGFLYWATDPLDNPDYERFALDFSQIVGMYPQTTTAQGHKYPERVRKILRVSQEHGCKVNRFSVLTEPFLRQIFAAYTPDELTGVEIVAQMRGGTVPKASAGAFRVLAKTRKNLVDFELKKLQVITDRSRKLAGDETPGDDSLNLLPAQPGTIACVSGFLLNMVKRVVKLISPCRASDRWPLGYIVFDERYFTDAEDLRRCVEEMIDAHMPMQVGADDVMQLQPGFNYEHAPGGFHVATPMNDLIFQRAEMTDYVRSIGDQVCGGRKTASQIAFSAFFEHGVPEANTLGTLEVLFQRGLLVDAKGRTVGGLQGSQQA